jgi:tetratricopeptide (TPR) repeat protein
VEPREEKLLLDQQQKDKLTASLQRGQALNNISIFERLGSLDSSAKDQLANFSILGMGLDFEGTAQYFEIGGLVISATDLLTWLAQCLETNLLLQLENTDNDIIQWMAPEEVYKYFVTVSKPEDLKRYHLNADQYLLKQLIQLAAEIGFLLSPGVTPREAVIQLYGFLDQISHLPQYQKFHHSILNFALNWYGHLVQLEAYTEAASILNHICFALARRGQRTLAENQLALIANKTRGLTSLAAQVNLASLLREENKTSIALRIYWKAIPGLLRHRAFIQLAQVLTHMAAIYRQNGKLVRSALVLECSVLLDGWLKDRKSQAISRAQLASTYRYLHRYTFAMNNASRAVEYFRRSKDQLNLGRSLMTKGNIYYNLSRSDSALECFEEALQIGQQINDPQTSIGARSGKGRVFLFLRRYDDAQTMLEEAISLRERNNDHNIGIEYENMGALFEQKGNFAIALGWYQKALEQFERYMPVEINNCQRKITLLEAKYRAH